MDANFREAHADELEALERENAQLRQALDSRVAIEQAKGVLAERYALDVDRAFDLLRAAARSNHLRIHALAAAVVSLRETPREVAELAARYEPAAAAGAGAAAEAPEAAALLAACRDELAPVARRLDEHRYLAAVEAGRVPPESLRSFAGEQRAILATGRRSLEQMALRFAEPEAAELCADLAAGEAEASSLLERFAAAVGLEAEEAYEPLPGCQAAAGHVARLAVEGAPADVALSLLSSLESWGRSCARMRDALRPRYGADAVAFFDFFAVPLAGVRDRGLALLATGEHARAARAARLLRAYELLYWDTLAGELR